MLRPYWDGAETTLKEYWGNTEIALSTETLPFAPFAQLLSALGITDWGHPSNCCWQSDGGFLSNNVSVTVQEHLQDSPYSGGTQAVPRLCSECTQAGPRLYPGCIQIIPRLYTNCTQAVMLRLYPGCSGYTQIIRRLCSDCTQNVIRLDPGCTRAVPRPYLGCTQAVLRL